MERTKRPLDAVCLTVWNGTHATLEKQEADSGEVSSQHSVGFFKDGCTNLLWRRAAGWLDWMGRDEPERQRAESQWIVAARPLCHLQYPVAYLSCLQRILPTARWKLYFKAATATLPPRRLRQRHVPLGSEAPTMCRPSQTPHLTMSSARIGPQSEPWVQKEGQCPASDSRNNSELAVRRAGKAPEGTVPSPSPGQHAATRFRRGSSSSSPPTADGFGTRGCSPWRPDVVMSMTGRGRHSVLRIFKGRRERTGHHAMCGALPAAGPYLRLSRFQGGQAFKQKR
ncbi:hypothetical protein CQW23_31501 [Capsicum baccatum]|uniref:Uncharacterized protein n=1 Tax=Capsicum baccatum TaxID=33114 RepID=A0A2G2V7F3_CAPBA|nr:hypothetical protein CQW23_31501 [Capsicum baccatum]